MDIFRWGVFLLLFNTLAYTWITGVPLTVDDLALNGNKLYVLSGSTVIVLDSKYGKMLYSYRLPEGKKYSSYAVERRSDSVVHVISGDFFVPPGILEMGLYTVELPTEIPGNTEGKFYSLAPSADTYDVVIGDTASDGNVMYIGYNTVNYSSPSSTGKILALENQTPLWNLYAGPEIKAVTANEYGVLLCQENRLLRINPGGEVSWAINYPCEAVSSNENIVCAVSSSSVLCLDSNGSPLFNKELLGIDTITIEDITVCSDKIILVGNPTLIILDINGDLIDAKSILDLNGEPLLGRVIICSEGTAYLGGNGFVAAVSLNPSEVVAPCPTSDISVTLHDQNLPNNVDTTVSTLSTSTYLTTLYFSSVSTETYNVCPINLSLESVQPILSYHLVNKQYTYQILVKNSGFFSLDNNVVLLVNGYEVDRNSCELLADNVCTVALSWTPSSVGTDLNFIVDPDNTVAETDETDNYYSYETSSCDPLYSYDADEDGNEEYWVDCDGDGNVDHYLDEDDEISTDTDNQDYDGDPTIEYGTDIDGDGVNEGYYDPDTNTFVRFTGKVFMARVPATSLLWFTSLCILAFAGFIVYLTRR